MTLTVLCVELRAPEWQDGPGQQGGTQCDADGVVCRTTCTGVAGRPGPARRDSV